MTLRQIARDSERVTAESASATASSRRRFLAATTSVAAAMAVPDAVQAAALQQPGLTASDFRGVLNTEFRATALSHPSLRVASLMLTEVAASRHPHPGLKKSRAAEMAFSLKFDVNDTGLSQDTYLLSHPTLGEFAALLVPTGNGKALRAEFHRL